MYRILTHLFVLFAFTCVPLGHYVHAQETDAESKGDFIDFIITADVSFNDAMISEQRNRELVIEFDLTNAGNPEKGIQYAVQLYKVITKDSEAVGEVLVHEHVYSEEVALGSGEITHKTITYTVPNALDGEYVVRMLAANKSGFEYSRAVLGTYTFTGSQLPDETYIDSSRCVLTIDGEVEMLSLLSGVDIDPNKDVLRIECAGGVDAPYERIQPRIVYRERSAFGDIVEEQKVLYGDIEKTDGGFTVRVRPPVKPQSYLAKLTYVRLDGTPVTNDVTFRLVVQGESATVKNATVDKDSYTAGEEATIRLMVGGRADIFPDARGFDISEYGEGATIPELTIQAQVVSDGVACTEKQTKKVPVNDAGFIEVRAPITTDCQNPVPVVSIVNDDGTLLSEANIEQSPKAVEVSGPSLMQKVGGIAGSILALLLLLVAGIFMVRMRKRHESNTPNVPPTAMMLFLVMLITGIFGVSENVQATSFTFSMAPYGILMDYEGTYDLQSSSVPCGGTVTGLSSMSISGCGNAAMSAEMKINNTSVYTYSHDADAYPVGFLIDSPLVSRNIGAVSANGQVRFDFTLAYTNTENQIIPRTVTQYKNYSVGTCLNYTTNAPSIATGCATLNEDTNTASAVVSITGVAQGYAIETYGFKCGSQPWVYQTGSTYTCTFSDPGSYNISYYVKTTNGVEKQKLGDKTVVVQDCNLNFDVYAEATYCAAPETASDGYAWVAIYNENREIDEYGFKCGDQDWVYQEDSEYVCNFSNPGEQTIRFYARDTSGLELEKEAVVEIEQCATEVTIEAGEVVMCAREGDPTRTSSVTMSFTGSGMPITQYGFDCDWNDANFSMVWQASPTYTCTYTTPGWKYQDYHYIDANGMEGEDYAVVYIPSCDVRFDHSATVLGCATAGNPSQTSSVDLSITGTDPDVTIVQYGFKCGSQPWFYGPGSTHTCTFTEPGDYPILFSAEDDLNSVGEEGEVVRVYHCDCDPVNASVTINGSSGNVAVTQGIPFTLGWSFTSPNSSYSCSLLAPTRSSLPATQSIQKVDSMPDTMTDPGNSQNEGQNNPYTLSCESVTNECAPVTRSVNAQISASPIQVTLTPNPAGTINVLDTVNWSITVDGGVPLDPQDYNISWTGDINDTGYYTNADDTPNNSIRVKNVQYGTLGVKTVTVTATDKWGRSQSATQSITVEDNSDPQ